MKNMVDPEKIRQMLDKGRVEESDTELIYNICDAVFYTHFPHKFDLRDELVQEGALGVIRLVDEGFYDEEKGNVLTFVYSRVRNCMSNFLYHEHKRVLRDVSIDEETKNGKIGTVDLETGGFGLVSEEMVQGILKFVETKIEELQIEDELEYYVKSYFMDKMGIRYELRPPSNFSLDFIEKYRYYVNTIEYGIFVKFINPKVFENRIFDLLDILESEGEVGFFMRMFLDSLSESQLTKLMYVFSMNAFQFPSKYKMLKIDNYLSIYKRVRYGSMSVEEAARFFDKPASTIESVVSKYDIIFS